MRADELALLLRHRRFVTATEAALQAGIGEALREWNVPFDREFRLSAAERIDFWVDGYIGIEAKVRYPKRSIYRQLQRYAGHDALKALILVTGTAMGLPAQILGKPVFYVSLGRSAL